MLPHSAMIVTGMILFSDPLPFSTVFYPRQGERVCEAHAVFTIFDTLHLPVYYVVFFVVRLQLLWMPGTPFFHSRVATCAHVKIFLISLSV